MSISLNLISLVFRILPRQITLFFGKVLGSLIYYLIPLRYNVALKNIKLSFPDKTPTELKILLKKTYKHFGIVLTDFLRQSNLNKDNISNYVIMDDETKNTLDRLDGGIIMTGHLGNWEIILPKLGLNNYPFVVVTQTQTNANSQSFFNKIRNFPNISLIPKNGSRKKMLLALEENKFLGLASDQNAGKYGIKIPFFKIPASIPKGAALFHLKTSMPIIIGFCILSRDMKYSLCLREMDLSEIPKDKDNAIKAINSYFTSELEKNIIKYPEQYFWFHRKWEKAQYA